MNPQPCPNALPRSPLAPRPWPAATRRTAWVAGIFCFLVALLLVVNEFQTRATDPLYSPRLTALKGALGQHPADEHLKQQIRTLDLQLRRRFERHLVLGEQARWLLFGGMAVFLLTLKSATYRKKIPRPPKVERLAGSDAHATAQARWAVGSLGLVLGGGAWLLSLHSETNLARQPQTESPAPTAAAAAPAAPATPSPTAEELQHNWPRFRGPGGAGVSLYTNLPATWNVATGENVLWKTVVPVPGPNSPVLWENRLFLTGATAKKREVDCFDTATGKLLWQKPVETPVGSSGEPPNVVEDSGGFAPATAATDGRRVYAIFATGDVGAFDLLGNPAWVINLGKPDNSYGHASSLATYQNRLLIQFDQGTGKDNKSKVLALDSATGKLVWQSAPRPVPNSWSTPIIIRANQTDQLITCGNPWVISYNPADGKEIWRAQALYGEVTPSPIFANGFVFTAIEGEKLSAIRPDGTGDVTKTHIKWSAEDGLPEISSPLSDGKYVYLITAAGLFTCYDAQTGKKQYEHDFEMSFKSSPSLAGDRIYLFSDKGLAIQVQAGPVFKELARCEMGEEVLSTPAFADGRLYLRAKQHLFCIGKK